MQFTYVEIVKVKPGNMDETLRKAEAELLPLYRQSPGFVAYTIAKTDEVSATALSIWQTREQAEHARNTGRLGVGRDGRIDRVIAPCCWLPALPGPHP